MCGLTSHITSRDDGRLDDRAKSVMSDKYCFKKEIVDKENNEMKMLDLFDGKNANNYVEHSVSLDLNPIENKQFLTDDEQ